MLFGGDNDNSRPAFALGICMVNYFNPGDFRSVHSFPFLEGVNAALSQARLPRGIAGLP